MPKLTPLFSDEDQRYFDSLRASDSLEAQKQWLIAYLKTKLNVPMDADKISMRTGKGKKEVFYITRPVATELLNTHLVFWSHQVVDGPKVVPTEPGKLLVWCTVRVVWELTGQAMCCVGTHATTPNELKDACKSAETDALKRATMLFGPATGSLLKDNDYVQQLEETRKRDYPVFNQPQEPKRYQHGAAPAARAPAKVAPITPKAVPRVVSTTSTQGSSAPKVAPLPVIPPSSCTNTPLSDAQQNELHDVIKALAADEEWKKQGGLVA